LNAERELEPLDRNKVAHKPLKYNGRRLSAEKEAEANGLLFKGTRTAQIKASKTATSSTNAEMQQKMVTQSTYKSFERDRKGINAAQVVARSDVVEIYLRGAVHGVIASRA
jgi:UDP-3-O-[3-hydroxymyristoyl] glucosamine N-acyltransferase